MLTAPILNAKDILAGEQGMIYITFANNKRMCVMHAKNIEATVSYEKEQVPILGKRGKGNRKTGETYSGSMTVYYVDSTWRKLAEVYKASGKDYYFDIEITNEDTTTETGTQIVTLHDCNFDEMTLAKLDADSAVLEEDVSFTFEDWTLNTMFDPLAGFFTEDVSDLFTIDSDVETAPPQI